MSIINTVADELYRIQDRIRSNIAYRKLRRNTTVNTDYTPKQLHSILGIKESLQECELAIWAGQWCAQRKMDLIFCYKDERYKDLSELPDDCEVADVKVVYVFLR